MVARVGAGEKPVSSWFTEVSALAPTLILLLVFYVLNELFLSPWILQESSYQSTIILVGTIAGTIKELAHLSLRSVLVLGVGAYLLFQTSRWPTTWRDLEDSGSARWLVFTSAAILAWIYSTYEYNYYFDQAHVIDRFLLIAFCLGIWFRPFMVFPFLVVLWPMTGQFGLPMGGYSWAVPFLLARFLLLMAAMLLMGMAYGKWFRKEFWFLALCILAGHYFTPGAAKLLSGWFIHDQVYYLLPNTHANGWLSFVSDETISTLTLLLSVVNPLLKLFTFVAEVGSLSLFLNRRSMRWFPLIWIGFHVGIYIMSGICFWPWVIINLVIMVALWRDSSLLAEPCRWKTAFAVLLIGLSPLWTKAVTLSWIDSPVTYTYQFTGLDSKGNEFPIAPSFLTPFEYQFTLGGLHYLSDAPNLGVTWGATDLTTANRLRAAGSAEEILDIEQEFGSRYLNEERTERLKQVIRAAMNHKQLVDRPLAWLDFVRAPAIVHTSRTNLDSHSNIEKVQVRRVLSGFVDSEYQELASISVADITLKAVEDQ